MPDSYYPKLKVNQDLFVFPSDKSYILFMPRQGMIAKTDAETISLLKRIQRSGIILPYEIDAVTKLKEIGVIIENKRDIDLPSDKYDPYCPVSVTLMPSFQCNLACVYCYSSGGEDVGSTMQISVATASIDTILENVVKLKKQPKSIELGFHGGGEPLIHNTMHIIKETVEYFKSESFKRGYLTKVSAATNGVIRKADLEWTVKNFDHLNISLDGPEEIQNRQRPKKGGGDSFNEVLNTIDYLNKQKFNYGLRATITENSTSKMPEIIKSTTHRSLRLTSQQAAGYVD